MGVPIALARYQVSGVAPLALPGATANGIAISLVNAGSSAIQVAGCWARLWSPQVGGNLYAVLEPVNSDPTADDGFGGALATLNLFPALRAASNDGDALVLENACGVFRLADDKVPWTIDQAMHYGLKFNAMEVC